MKLAASIGTIASESSMKSPRCESSSSPMGVSSETGSCDTLRISRTLSAATPIREPLPEEIGQQMGVADLLGERLAAQVLKELALHPDQLVDGLHHVHGDPDRAGLVGDGPGDGLSDPPRGICRELVTLGIVELLHRSDQPEVALLDQVEEEHPSTDVPLGDRYHEG